QVLFLSLLCGRGFLNGQEDSTSWARSARTAWEHLDHGRSASAKASFEDALARAAAAKAPLGECLDIQRGLAWTHRRLGHSSQAEALAKQSLRTIEQEFGSRSFRRVPFLLLL